MPKELFGTDGIRGVPGTPPLDDATLYATGRSLGTYLKQTSPAAHVLIGMDTRESGPHIAALLAAGLANAGVSIDFAGIITTPGVACLVRQRGFQAGVVISASHNPFQDNGVKLFSSAGMKFPDAVEETLEEDIFKHRREPAPKNPPGLAADETLDARYLDFLRSKVIPGAKLSSLHLEGLQKCVVAERAGLGIAFDGDADRAMFVCQSGRVVNGDGVLLAAARQLKSAGKLKGNRVVATSMSNLGLERVLAREGIELARAAVGDRYVLEEMLRSNNVLGGEQSGHVIFLDDSPAGDGLLTAVKIASLVSINGRLESLITGLKDYPQTIVNVKVKSKPPLESLPQVSRALAEAQSALGDNGRVVLRYSGTEPLARVMVEAERDADVQRYSQALVDALRESIGA